jgi:flagella basal body P-ring formation protein FlgA
MTNDQWNALNQSLVIRALVIDWSLGFGHWGFDTEVVMMDNNNRGRPLGRKQTVRLMIALTIMAWATQTLLKQWGYGAQIPATVPVGQHEDSQEKFVPGNPRFNSGATLELRSEATIVGAEVKLRQVCRWADADQAIFEPMGDLVLVRLGARAPFRSISVEEIRAILREAAVNTAAINFAGSMSCTVTRSDVEYDEQDGLRQWIEAKQGIVQSERQAGPSGPGQAAAFDASPTTRPAAGATSAPSEPNPVQTLRDALLADLASRLNLPVESLQVDFKAHDQQTLNVSRPLFTFEIEPLRAKSLGEVLWNVTISSGGADKRRVSIAAEARAWQDQLVVAKPLAARQVIRSEDVIARRTLVDQVGDDPLLTSDQVVGQQAGRELKPGTVLTGKLIDPVQLVKVGQFITVTLEQGTVRIKTVARAMESGSYGQTIRVKNEATREVFQVVLTGPQTATMNLASPVASAAPQN